MYLIVSHFWLNHLNELPLHQRWCSQCLLSKALLNLAPADLSTMMHSSTPCLRAFVSKLPPPGNPCLPLLSYFILSKWSHPWLPIQCQIFFLLSFEHYASLTHSNQNYNFTFMCANWVEYVSLIRLWAS